MAGEIGNKEWRNDLDKHPSNYLPNCQEELLPHQRDMLIINARIDASAAFAMTSFLYSRIGLVILLQVITIILVLVV